MHEVSNKKSLMSRIEDFGRKHLKLETENDKFPSLESLIYPEILNPQDRTTASEYIEWLKGYIYSESQPRTNDIEYTGYIEEGKL